MINWVDNYLVGEAARVKPIVRCVSTLNGLIEAGNWNVEELRGSYRAAQQDAYRVLSLEIAGSYSGTPSPLKSATA